MRFISDKSRLSSGDSEEMTDASTALINRQCRKKMEREGKREREPVPWVSRSTMIEKN